MRERKGEEREKTVKSLPVPHLPGPSDTLGDGAFDSMQIQANTTGAVIFILSMGVNPFGNSTLQVGWGSREGYPTPTLSVPFSWL